MQAACVASDEAEEDVRAAAGPVNGAAVRLGADQIHNAAGALPSQAASHLARSRGPFERRSRIRAQIQDSVAQVRAMRAAHVELKKATQSSGLHIDEIDKLQDEMADIMDLTNEIQEALGRSYEAPDDMDEAGAVQAVRRGAQLGLAFSAARAQLARVWWPQSSWESSRLWRRRWGRWRRARRHPATCRSPTCQTCRPPSKRRRQRRRRLGRRRERLDIVCGPRSMTAAAVSSQCACALVARARVNRACRGGTETGA